MLPAQGELGAIGGYSSQYLVSAEIIYRALLDETLEWIWLASVEAGKVDDFQIGTPTSVDAFQVKWSQVPSSISYGYLRGANSSNAGMVHELAEGWLKLSKKYPDHEVRVHLVSNAYASTRSIILADKNRYGALQLFLNEEWNGSGDERAKAWIAVLDDLREASSLKKIDFTRFRKTCFFDLEYSLPTGSPSNRYSQKQISEIKEIASLLFMTVGQDRRALRMSRRELLLKMGWSNRFEFAAAHEFPVSKTYSPISATIQDLNTALTSVSAGYLALLGAPGSGKSTLISATLKYKENYSVIRYYCYVPDDARVARGEAYSFLHDLVLSMWRSGVRPPYQSLGSTIEELRACFTAQIKMLGDKGQERGVRTLIVIDGLDHIDREYHPARSLITELPDPGALPDGVIFLLGSQKLDLSGLNPRIALQLQESGRALVMSPMSRKAMHQVIGRHGLVEFLTDTQIKKIERVSAGHPLTLNYLLSRITGLSGNELDDVINSAATYSGRIEQDYELYWTTLKSDPDVVDLLALMSRVREYTDLIEAVNWVGQASVKKLMDSGGHYFEKRSATQWSFYHNSFRQFVLDKTGRNIFGAEDDAQHKNYHDRLAKFAERQDAPRWLVWQKLFHLAAANKYRELIDQSSQALFRGQLQAFRPVNAIRDDISMVMRAASEMDDRIAIIRMLLIDDEISQRHHELDQIDFADLLVELGRVDLCVDLAAEVKTLNIDADSALRVSKKLYETGRLRDAELIFDLAEPLDLLNSAKPIDSYNSETRDVLFAWADSVVHFRSLKEIVKIVRRLKVKKERNGGGANKVLHANLYDCIADAIVLKKDGALITEFLSLIKPNSEADRLRARIDAFICLQFPASDEASEALSRAVSAYTAGELSYHYRLIAASLSFRRGKLEQAKKLIAGMKQPALVNIVGMREGSIGDFLPKLRLSRLLSALGQTVEVGKAVPPATGDLDRGAVLFERMIVQIGLVWGAGWSGNTWGGDRLARALAPAIRIFERDYASSERLHGWYSYKKMAAAYFSLLLQAAATHGFDALSAIVAEIEARWAAPSSIGYWPIELRQKIVLSIFELNKNTNLAERLLNDIQGKINALDAATDRFQCCKEQVICWFKLGFEKSAEILLPTLLETSFGIHYEKDPQAHEWLEWTIKAYAHDAAEVHGQLPRLILGFSRVALSNAGYQPTQLVRSFLEFLFEKFPGIANVVRRDFTSKGVLNDFNVIVALCGSAAHLPVENTRAVVPLFKHIVLPYSRHIESDLVEGLFRKLSELTDDAERSAISESIVNHINIDGQPSDRRECWGAIQKAGFDIEFPPDTSKKQAVDELLGSAKVTLRSGRQLTKAALVDELKIGDAVSLLNEINQHDFLSWREVVDVLSSVLPTDRRLEAIRILIELGCNAADIAPLAENLDPNTTEETVLEVMRSALKNSKAWGWIKRYDGGSRLIPYQKLTKLNPDLATQGVRAFVRDYLAEIRNPRDMVMDLDGVAQVFWADPPIGEIWREVKEHFFALDEFRFNEASPIIYDANPITLASIVSEVLFELLKLPMPELRQDVFRAVIDLYLTDTNARSSIHSHVGSLLSGDNDGILVGLALLLQLRQKMPDFTYDLSTKVYDLATHDDMAVRGAAIEFLVEIGVGLPPRRTGTLAPTYSLSLPPFPTLERPDLKAFPAEGTVLPETNDPLELTGVIDNALQHLEEVSGFQYRNLVERAVSYMRSITSVTDWNAEAERKLMADMKASGFRTSFRRPRAKAALEALGHMVAELFDARIIGANTIGELDHYLRLVDLSVLNITRHFLQDPMIETGLEDEAASSREDWVEELISPIIPPITTNGMIVVGLKMKAQRLNWSQPKVIRSLVLGYMQGSPIVHTEIGDKEHLVIPSSPVWSMRDYPNLKIERAVEQRAIVIERDVRRVEIGSSEWLAFNPYWAERLGWTFSREGVFRWLNDDGDIMAESFNWKNGRLGREPYSADLRHEGWLVKVSREAMRQLHLLIPGAIWLEGGRKFVNNRGAIRTSSFVRVAGTL
jgi:hypothetical protein